MKQIKNWKEIHRTTNYQGHPMYVFEIEHIPGYRVHITEAEYKHGGLDISIESMKDSFETPNIYVDGWGVQKARVQTTSYGSISSEELDLFVKALQNAQALIHELETVFPECFTK